MNSINNVGTDYLVRRHWEIQDAKVYSGARLLRQADASSFETLNYLYARDAARVYYTFGTIDEADPSSFEVLDSGAQSAGAGKSLLSFSGFARDKNNVYHYRYTIGKPSIVRGADRDTFHSLDGEFGRDRHSVFIDHRKIKHARN